VKGTQKVLALLGAAVLILAAGCGNPWLRELFKDPAPRTVQKPVPPPPLILRVDAGADKAFTIPANNSWAYDWYIDWGDGTAEEHKTGTGALNAGIGHTFPADEEYDITIRAAGNTGHAAFGFRNIASGPNAGANKQKLLKALGHLAENTSVAEFPDAWAYCFYDCTSLNEVSAALLPAVPNGTSRIFHRMFYGCGSLAALPPGFTLPAVPNGTDSIFHCMFAGCGSLAALPDGFTLPAVPEGTSSIFAEMFFGCSSLAALPDGFTLPAVANGTSWIFAEMFSGCSSLAALPAGFTLPAAPKGTSSIFYYMFYGCSNLAASINDLITAPVMDGIRLNGTDNMSRTFYNCGKLTGSAQAAIQTGFGGAAPNSDRNTFSGCPGLDLSGVHVNWQ
jgi:hypothetical protein